MPVLVMRAIWAGYSGVELAEWPGTMRVRTRVIADYVFDIIHSLAEMGFRKIATVNGHGHHPAILEMVAREIADATGVYIACIEAAKMAAPAVIELNRRMLKSFGLVEFALMFRFEECRTRDVVGTIDRSAFIAMEPCTVCSKCNKICKRSIVHLR